MSMSIITGITFTITQSQSANHRYDIYIIIIFNTQYFFKCGITFTIDVDFNSAQRVLEINL